MVRVEDYKSSSRLDRSVVGLADGCETVQMFAGMVRPGVHGLGGAWAVLRRMVVVGRALVKKHRGSHRVCLGR